MLAWARTMQEHNMTEARADFIISRRASCNDSGKATLKTSGRPWTIYLNNKREQFHPRFYDHVFFTAVWIFGPYWSTTLSV
jgi:hypothetical protein